MTAPTAPGAADGEPPRASVLMVDDQPANLLALEGILEPLGQRLVRAGSGEEALQRLLEEDFALILMDVQMPGLDGLEAARLIKERPRCRHIPIIFITAISREADYVFRAYRTGAVDYIRKPVDAEVLRAKARVFIDLHLKTETVKRQQALLREAERREAERRSERRYRVLIDSIPHCVLAARRDGGLNLCNEVWTRLTGLSREASAGLGFLDAIDPAGRDAFRDAWLAATAREEPFEVQVGLRRSADGACRAHLLRAVPERDEGGAVAGWIATATDVHEQREAEAALRRALAAKDTFLAAASHELRTPLTSAKLQAEIGARALAGAPDHPVAKPLAVIARQLDRMNRLVENMLDLNKLERGQLELDLSSFDLAPVVREACELVQASAPKHQIRVAGPGRLTVTADRHRLEQVFANLLLNAVRYSPEGGPIEVSAALEGAEVHVAIRDRGLGVPADLQKAIFEPFAQAHGLSYGGLGLGLTIARTIIERHGGSVVVESSGEPGAGATFHVRFPACARPRAGRPREPGARAGGRSPRGRG